MLCLEYPHFTPQKLITWLCKAWLTSSMISQFRLSLPTDTLPCLVCFPAFLSRSPPPPWMLPRHWYILQPKHFSPGLSSVQLLSRVWLIATPWIAARQASRSITNSRSSLKFMSIESVMPSSHLILCRPLLLLPPIPPSIRVFSNESTLHHQVAKVLEFQLQHQSFQWTPRTDLL